MGFGAIQRLKSLCTEFSRLSSYRLTQEKSSASPPPPDMCTEHVFVCVLKNAYVIHIQLIR